jgi:(E)-4-hydroxy-3-methylbut-2-enyl-diphosphate synthase
MIKRKKTRSVRIAQLEIGGDSPISVQSMTNTDTRNAEKTIEQIKRLENEGCELVRVAIPNMESCKNIPIIKENIKIPLVADIHFDYRLALKSMDYGVDGIRINPGNIKIKENITNIISLAKKKNIAIRFGINSGSLDTNIIKKFEKPNVAAIIETAEKIVKVLKETKFKNAIFSLKSTNIINTIESNEIFSKKYDYPLHIGITESGFSSQGIVKSSAGLGILLYKGIGDTIRVSLTEDPVKEVKIGYEILQSLGIRKKSVNIISCPTCGRCEVDLSEIVKELDKRISNRNKTLTVAVMGCIVNGPGEAKEADIGIAFNKKIGVLFRKGKLIGKYDKSIILNKLLGEIDKF